MWACIKGVTLGIDFNDGNVAKFFSLATFFLILMTVTLQFQVGVVAATTSNIRVVVTVTASNAQGRNKAPTLATASDARVARAEQRSPIQ